MTFTAYSPRVARGVLSDDFSKSQGVADQVRKDIERDAIERALKWQSSEIRKNIRGAQPVQMGQSEPGMAEKLLGIGANYLKDKGVFDNGLRGVFGGGSSNMGSLDLGGNDVFRNINTASPYLDAAKGIDYGINLTSPIDFAPVTTDFGIPSTKAFSSGVNYF